MPGQIEVFPRGRWCGCKRVADEFALMASCHGLLWDAIILWDQRAKAKAGTYVPAPALPPTHDDEDEYDGPPGLCDDEDSDDEDDGFVDDAAAARQARDEAAVLAVAGAKAGQVGVDVGKHNRKLRTDCTAWARRRPTAEVTILSRALGAPARLVHGLLYRSGKKFDKDNAIKRWKNEPGTHRIIEDHKCELEIRYATGTEALMSRSDAWAALDPKKRTMESRTKSFAFTARNLTGMYLWRWMPQRQLPKLLFALLLSPTLETAQALLDTPKHLVDPFTASHFKKYGTKEDLISDDSLLDLEFVAELALVDIAALEVGHGHAKATAKRSPTLDEQWGFTPMPPRGPFKKRSPSTGMSGSHLYNNVQARATCALKARNSQHALLHRPSMVTSSRRNLPGEEVEAAPGEPLSLI